MRPNDLFVLEVRFVLPRRRQATNGQKWGSVFSPPPLVHQSSPELLSFPLSFFLLSPTCMDGSSSPTAPLPPSFGPTHLWRLEKTRGGLLSLAGKGEKCQRHHQGPVYAAAYETREKRSGEKASSIRHWSYTEEVAGGSKSGGIF